MTTGFGTLLNYVDLTVVDSRLDTSESGLHVEEDALDITAERYNRLCKN